MKTSPVGFLLTTTAILVLSRIAAAAFDTAPSVAVDEGHDNDFKDRLLQSAAYCDDPARPMLFQLDLEMNVNDGLRLAWQLYEVGPDTANDGSGRVSGGSYMNNRYAIRHCLDPTVCYQFGLKMSQPLSEESWWQVTVDGRPLFTNTREKLSYTVYFGSTPCQRMGSLSADTLTDPELLPKAPSESSSSKELKPSSLRRPPSPQQQRQRQQQRPSPILQEINALGSTSPYGVHAVDGTTTAAAGATPYELSRFINVMERLETMEHSRGGAAELINSVVLAETDDEAEPEVRRKQPVGEGTVSWEKSKSRWQISNPFIQQPPIVKEREEPENQDSFLGRAIRLMQSFLIGTISNSTTTELNYAPYPVHEEYPDEDLSMMKMLNGVPPLEYSFSIEKLVRVLKRFLRIYVGLKLNQARSERAPTYQQKYVNMFSNPNSIFSGFFRDKDEERASQLAPIPERLIETWKDDAEMARQFIAGTNPVMIRVVDDLAKLSNVMIYFLEERGIIVEELMKEKRLLYATYEGLAKLRKRPHETYPPPYNGDGRPEENNHFHPAVIVFELEPTKREELSILAIQLELEENFAEHSRMPIYSRDTSTEAEWLMAKTCVMVADSQYHEWVNHLGRTHLMFEPHIIAIHRTLRQENHPLFDFLKPLTKDTLFLNWAARQTLAEFGEDSFGDRVSSVGTGQFMQLIRDEWVEYDFFRSSALPNELTERGFHTGFDFPGYLYREDGMKLWDAMGQFAVDFVDEVYDSDESVADDGVLQRWAAETVDPEKANVKGFPQQFTEKRTLAHTLQTMMWMSTALHAAVNYPQYDYLAFAPNKPLGARAGMEQFQASDEKSEEFVFREVNPFFNVAREVIYIVRILTLPAEAAIDNILGHFEGARYGRKAYIKFVQRLDEIGDQIDTRNKATKRNGGAVYSYLHPSNVPCSINI